MDIIGLLTYFVCSIPIIWIFLFINRNVSLKRKITFSILLYVVTLFTQGLFIEFGLIGNNISLAVVGVLASLLYAVTLSLVIRGSVAEVISKETSSKSHATQDSGPDQISDADTSIPIQKKSLDPLYKVAIIQGVFTIIAALIAKLL